MPIITLSEAEQQTLQALTLREHSALDFWQHVLHARGYASTRTAIPMISPQGYGTYRLEWTSRKLGPASIAEGRRLGKVRKY